MSIAALAAELRDGHHAGTPRRIVGAGTWLDAGNQVNPEAAPLAMHHLRGITEYVPGDLTLTALAGTPLSELHAATRANGQRVALDPYGSDAGTLGATVATASAGPSAGAFGTPRDQVLGVTFVTGTGDVVHAGGRVVKNVAGFDLVRLTVGAWGTLGVVAEVSVRLRALPAVDDTLLLPLDTTDETVVAGAVTTLRALPFTFEALELLDAGMTRALGLTQAPGGGILARAAGSADVLRAMQASLAAAGAAHPVDPAVWDRLRALEPPGTVSLRLSHAASRWSDVWRTARALAVAGDGFAHLSIGRTVARVALRTAAALQRAVAFDGTIIAERADAAVRASLAVHLQRHNGGTPVRITRGVRDAFDPARLLNPGILGAAGGEG